MTTPEPGPPDDLLARAEDALRRIPVPEGPSDEAVARILAALHAASGPRPPVAPRRRVGRWALRASAAAVLVAGLGYLVVAWPPRTALAFAEVAQKLRDARTIAYRMTMQVAGQPGPVVSRTLVKAPALIRCEVDPGGLVTIFDAARNRTLVLDPESRSALLMEGTAPSDMDARDMAAEQVEGLRRLVEAKGEPVGRRRIGGIEVQGFRARQGWQELLVWVDPQAKLPVRVDLKARINDVEITGRLDDFRLDPPLDDALFRLEPPAGYTLTRGRNAGMGDDEAIAELLRSYAEHAEGNFPARIDDWADYARRRPEGKARGATNPETIRLVQTVARVQVFLLEREGDYGYRPEGVELGDAGKILFWFRPKGSDRYRAIFGDLHAEDVTPDQLPGQTGPRPRED